MQTESAQFYSGISGVALPVPISQYPVEFQSKSRLHYYASLFNSVEVNSIFYKLPRATTIGNWRETVPDNFRFTFKVSKTITHVKGLNFNEPDVVAFVNTVSHIGDKKGCLLVQFPPSLKIDSINELQNLIEALGKATQDEWRIAIEFRNKSWYERELYELLVEFNITLVIQDMASSATPLTNVVGDFVYLRFHGPEPRYSGDYSTEALKKYAGLIKEWMTDGKTVFAYFNNTMGNAVGNLQALNKYVRL